MGNLFRDSVGFNSNISQWDVGRVTDMSGMFYNEESFNVDIRDWNVRRVTDMSDMFYGAETFIPLNDIFESWGRL